MLRLSINSGMNSERVNRPSSLQDYSESKRIPRAGYIPRTLVGAGGVRLYDIPGVIYPDYMLSDKKKLERGGSVILSTPPSWAISTREAARILGCNPSSARELLHRKRVRFCRVAIGPCPPTAYWDRGAVRRLAKKRRPVISDLPERLVNTTEAAQVLQVSKNTLCRYARSGYLQKIRLRTRREDGARLRNYYLRSEVEAMKARRELILSSPVPIPRPRERFLGTKTEAETQPTS